MSVKSCHEKHAVANIWKKLVKKPLKCNKHIIQCFDVEYGIYFMSETGFLIFSRVSHEWNKCHIQHQSIEYPQYFSGVIHKSTCR